MKTHRFKTHVTHSSNDYDNVWSRDRVLVAVFFLATMLLMYWCYLLARPFVPALAWALVFAVVAHPIHQWIKKRVHSARIAAAASVLLVAVMIVAPSVFVLRTILQQATATLNTVQSGKLDEKLRSIMESKSGWASLFEWIDTQANSKDLQEQIATSLGKWITKLLGGSASGVVSLLIAFFLLFYFLRDRESVIAFVRSLLPLSDRESNQVMRRVRETIFASVFGTLAVATVQGTLGGLMFWWLGLPAPLLWGVVMGLLSIIPVLGAFVIWIPAAIYLAMAGDWGKALILAVWGTVVIGLIDNLLYPILVGTRLRLHTVPVFVAIVGGLIVFGPSGLILGPVILALTDAAIEVWRCRTARGNSAVSPC